MSTTIPTTDHHKALMSAALVVALLALALAVAGFVTALGHTTTSSTAGTHAPVTSMAMADSSVKVQGGAVLPLETVTDADLTYVVPVSPTEYQNLPTVHVQPGPVG